MNRNYFFDLGFERDSQTSIALAINRQKEYPHDA